MGGRAGGAFMRNRVVRGSLYTGFHGMLILLHLFFYHTLFEAFFFGGFLLKLLLLESVFVKLGQT